MSCIVPLFNHFHVLKWVRYEVSQTSTISQVTASPLQSQFLFLWRLTNSEQNLSNARWQEILELRIGSSIFWKLSVHNLIPLSSHGDISEKFTAACITKEEKMYERCSTAKWDEWWMTKNKRWYNNRAYTTKGWDTQPTPHILQWCCLPCTSW